MPQIFISVPLPMCLDLLKDILCVAMFLVGGVILLFIAVIVEDELEEKKGGTDQTSKPENNHVHNEP